MEIKQRFYTPIMGLLFILCGVMTNAAAQITEITAEALGPDAITQTFTGALLGPVSGTSSVFTDIGLSRAEFIGPIERALADPLNNATNGNALVSRNGVLAIAAPVNQPAGYGGDLIDFIPAGSGFRFLVDGTATQFGYTIVDNPAVPFVIETYLNGTQQNSYEYIEPVGNLQRYFEVTTAFDEFRVLLGPGLRRSWGVDDITLANRGAVNVQPIADAGSDQSIRAGASVYLNGLNSFDDNTESLALDYVWEFVSQPSGSNATLLTGNTGTASFEADMLGTYVVDLVVTDEAGLSSVPDEIEISTDNLAPTAVATVDFGLVIVQTISNFDGTGSTDPEEDSLSYSWIISAAPMGSTVTLANASTDSPSLITDVEGSYLLTLTVSDFIGTGTPATVEVVATRPAIYAETQIVEACAVAETLMLDQVTTKGNQNAFCNILKQATKDINKGKISNAIFKLNEAIERTDGCALLGSPDGNGDGRDWITDCVAQDLVYPQLTEALNALSL